MTEHRFGGPWTQIKLDILRGYLNFYTTALKNKRFRLVYIDAFAGSGDCYIEAPVERQRIDGSAKIALSTNPPFDEYVFVEQDSERFAALETLAAQHRDRTIRLYQADVNETIPKLCRSMDWNRTRAVLFLDPYGLEVYWSTLKTIAETRAIDVWFLFSLSGLYRQAARRMTSVEDYKARRLDLCMGTDAWRDAFYSEPPIQDMFGADPALERHADVDDMEAFVQRRLNEVFGAVLSPKRLYRKNSPLFSLFFAVASQKEAAIRLSTKAAKHLLKQV